MIYYIHYIESNQVKILETIKPETKKGLKDWLQYINESIKVYTTCTNTGLYGLVYAKNQSN